MQILHILKLFANFETIFANFESRIAYFESRSYKKLRVKSSLEVLITLDFFKFYQIITLDFFIFLRFFTLDIFFFVFLHR